MLLLSLMHHLCPPLKSMHCCALQPAAQLCAQPCSLPLEASQLQQGVPQNAEFAHGTVERVLQVLDTLSDDKQILDSGSRV